jgi:hypothetical protein
MSTRAGQSRLFHTIVVVGLAFDTAGCGGQTASTVTVDASGGGPGFTPDAEASSADATSRDDATAAGDALSVGVDSPADADDAGTAADAYGYENDAGICVCPPRLHRSAPCCPPGFGNACASWPCYI